MLASAGLADESGVVCEYFYQSVAATGRVAPWIDPVASRLKQSNRSGEGILGPVPEPEPNQLIDMYGE